jgi:hypothetical protein
MALHEAIALNNRILACGVFALVDLEGNCLWFYPKGRLPRAWDEISGDDAKMTLLRDFLVNLGRLQR